VNRASTPILFELLAKGTAYKCTSLSAFDAQEVIEQSQEMSPPIIFHMIPKNATSRNVGYAPYVTLTSQVKPIHVTIMKMVEQVMHYNVQ
jgi:hypothetical protein